MFAGPALSRNALAPALIAGISLGLGACGADLPGSASAGDLRFGRESGASSISAADGLRVQSAAEQLAEQSKPSGSVPGAGSAVGSGTEADLGLKSVLAAIGTGPDLRWMIAGGGSLPSSNQVSIEQDLGLALEVFGDSPGLLLFAGGPGTRTVQVQRELANSAPSRDGEGENFSLDVDSVEDPLALALADLFAPRSGRGARYRRTTLPAVAEATAGSVLGVLEPALGQSTDKAFLLYIAGHGEIGASAGDNYIALWGGSRLGVRELAEVVDGGARPFVLVLTTCFSGGFAELAFANADPEEGAAKTPRCGLFSSTWDLEASGCDPNPDRGAQEGYGLHFLAALRGLDRDGRALAEGVLDLDGDGEISLLEAHTRARIAAMGIGVPTTTSERWLRQVAPITGRSVEVLLPEESAVILALSAELGLDPAEPGVAATQLAEREKRIDERKARLRVAQEEEERAYGEAAAAILGRWPVLDDPWHPDFVEMYSGARIEIAEHLRTSASYQAYLDAREEVIRFELEISNLRHEAARYERLARALETRRLAGRLARRGGPEWAHYERLLACERGFAPS